MMLLLGSSLLAQQATPPNEKEDDIPVFRTGVTLVKVDVEVTARDGKTISDLTQQDFTVFDENQPQPVTYFGRELEPLDLLLLLDVSGSMRKSLEDLAAGTRAALAQLHPGDRVALMLFSRRTNVIQPFTEEFSGAQHKILDSIYKADLGNGTLINESLIEAAGYMKQQPVKGRRAILVVTDNEGLNYKSPDEAVVRAMFSAETVLSALVVRKGARPARGQAHRLHQSRFRSAGRLQNIRADRGRSRRRSRESERDVPEDDRARPGAVFPPVSGAASRAGEFPEAAGRTVSGG